MARAALSVQDTVRTGLNATYTAAAADGHAFDNSSEKVILHVKNGGAGACVVSIDTPRAVDGLALPALTVSIPAGEDRFIGPFPAGLYNQANAALSITKAVHVNTDVQTSVTYAAIKAGSLAY